LTQCVPLRRLQRIAVLGLLLLPACSALRRPHATDFTASPHFAVRVPRWPTPRELCVVTFNIHDLYWWSDHRAERIPAIAEALAAQRPDVVCLQEGFVGGDVAVIAAALREVDVEHCVDFPSGAFGSGMWILSRFPIHETFFRKFSRNGSWTDTRGGDWWAGKGVALARLDLGDGQLLDIYDTHLICPLGPDASAHRRVQVRELAAFVSGATPPNVPALICGDFNSTPGSSEFAYLGYTLRWQLLLAKRWRDHICGYALLDAYHFEPLGEVELAGTVEVAEDERVSWSDHEGKLVRVLISPQPETTADTKQ
jgi:endonuclease/exonuclease/phosphatase family metal-dependent hydrolase